jgi:hypothetical protein
MLMLMLMMVLMLMLYITGDRDIRAHVDEPAGHHLRSLDGQGDTREPHQPHLL